MILAKVLHNWYNATALVIASIIEGTVDKMTGNATFTTPTIPLAQMTGAANRIRTAWNNRDNGDAGKEELTNAVNDGIAKLNTQAEYVDDTVRGDKTKLLSSGFKATSDLRHPATEPAQAAAAKVESLPAGKLKLGVNKVEGADKYHWIVFVGAPGTVTVVDNQIKTVPATDTEDVLMIPAGHIHEEISQLPSLKKVFVGVCAANSAGIASVSPLVEAHTL